MTISTATASASYTGNGTTTAFPIPFYFLVDTDVKISKKDGATGTISVLTLNSDYTLTGAGNQAGGTATMTTAPAGGATPDQLFIERNVDAVQETAYPENGIFPAASHEKALDRLTMLVQQILSKLTFGLFRNPLAATYDLGGNTLSNIANAVNAQDVPSLAQTQTLVTSAATGIVPSLIATLTQLAASAGASLIGFLQAGTGATVRTGQAKLREIAVSVGDFGAKSDGATDDTAACQAAINYINTTFGGGVVRFPVGTTLTGTLIIYSGITLAGESRESSIVKLKSGTNADLIQGYDTPALHTSKPYAGGLTSWGLRDIQLDGNRAGNTSGHCVNVYGAKPCVTNVFIKNAPERGLWTEHSDTAQTFGMEGLYKNIVIDTSGKDGLYFQGPHDSHFHDVIVIDSSQTATNAYDGIYVNSSARWVQCHAWTRGTKPHRYAANFDTNSFGNDVSACHFEGGYSASLRNLGGQNSFDSCRVYAPTNGLCFLLLAACRFTGWIDYQVSGAPASVGIQFGDATHGITGCDINAIVSTQAAGVINFSNTTGGNWIRMRGGNGSGTFVVGSPHNADFVDIDVSGNGGGQIKKVAGLAVTATGTTQATAAPVITGAVTQITGGAVNSGVVLPAAAMGQRADLFNATAGAIIVYPPSGSRFGLGTYNAGISLASGLTASCIQTAPFSWAVHVSNY
jgi:hypothetical protein